MPSNIVGERVRWIRGLAAQRASLLRLALVVLVAGMVLVPALGSAWAAPTQALPVEQAVPTYTIWGNVMDSVTGVVPPGALIRVYRRDPITGEFWGIDGPQGFYIHPDSNGYWSVDYTVDELGRPRTTKQPYPPIDWLVVTLIYAPGWSSLHVQAPVRSTIEGARVDLRYPPEGMVGPFDFTLTLPTPTPTSTATPTATATATEATVVPPTSTPTITPTETEMPTATPTETEAPTATPTATEAPTVTPTATEVPTIVVPTATPTRPIYYFPLLFR
jgi:hypothetical protein